MSADEHDPPGRRPRAVRPAAERRGRDRRAGGGARGAPGGIERRKDERRRPPAPAPSLDIASTRTARAVRTGRSGRDEERRREALRSMLEMADERQARAAARRRSRPVMAPGVTVQVLAGPFAGEPATIADADYISNRVLVRLDELEESLWLDFAEVRTPPERADD